MQQRDGDDFSVTNFVEVVVKQTRHLQKLAARKAAVNDVDALKRMVKTTAPIDGVVDGLLNQLDFRVSPMHANPYRAMFTYGETDYVVYRVDPLVAAADTGMKVDAFGDRGVWRAVSYDTDKREFDGTHAFYFTTATELCEALWEDNV